MIIGVGVDICDISRIKKILLRDKEQFKARILANGEICKDTPEAFAKRFAAKEAVSKALGCGIGSQLSFQDITLAHHESGQPYVALSAKATERFGDITFHLSLSDEAGLAAAYVVAEKAS
ncbi:MAG: holo-ACP synthase [Alphaproteobacteria bacterium]|nr:holo-ACP synthase [Alphaproteobacteria bacterium]